MTRTSHRYRQRALAAAPGFTLVELMVALSGGLFLSIVVFALARDASRFYQREGRVGTATLAGMIGFERLKADIARAGYLSTPNIQLDPARAINVAAGNPAGIFTLAGLRITPDTPTANTALQANALAPDQIVLSGSYSATDEFPAVADPSGQTIFLQVNTPSMARLGYLTAGNPLAQLALLRNVFSPGLILRFKDQAGRLYFGQITAVTGGTPPAIALATPFPQRSSATGANGLRGFEVGSSANVVNIVRYRVLDLQNNVAGPQWQALFDASKGAAGEDTRTELVRDQLMADGNVLPKSTEVVAEYAVDLGFSVFGQPVAGLPAVVYSAPGDGNFGTFFNSAGIGDFPERVRSVRTRLSVRSREADRTAGIPGGFYRFQIAASQWARVRTFQADVALPNQASVQW